MEILCIGSLLFWENIQIYRGILHNYVELHCVLYVYREPMWIGGNYET